MQSQFWSYSVLENYQNIRLQSLIKHAYENVPYYTELFNKIGLSPNDIKTKHNLHKYLY